MASCPPCGQATSGPSCSARWATLNWKFALGVPVHEKGCLKRLVPPCVSLEAWVSSVAAWRRPVWWGTGGARAGAEVTAA